MEVQYRNCGIERVDILVDVGANHGQFVRQILSQYPVKRVLAIEMLPDLVLEMAREFRAVAGVELLECAVGERVIDRREGRGVRILRCGYDQASSLLPVEPRSMELYHRDLSQFDGGLASMCTLDWAMSEFLRGTFGDVDLLKIDVQGYEMEVLRGAVETLARTRYVLIEANCVPCYVGGSTFSPVHEFLTCASFELRYFLDGYIDPSTGIMVHSDVLYEAV